MLMGVLGLAATGLAVVLVIAMLFGPPAGDGPTAAPARAEAETASARTIDVSSFRAAGRSDAQAVQAAIDAAAPGDTVFFPGGVYDIDEPFRFGSGVNHVGDSRSPAVLTGRGAVSVLLRHDSAHPLAGTVIQGLHFDNIELEFAGDPAGRSFTDITLQDCVFENGRRREPWSSDYVKVAHSDGFTVDGCTFLRNAKSGGRGVVFERTRLTVVKDSYFGTTRDLEPNAPNGYFKTAVNVNGYDAEFGGSAGVTIDGNVLRRAARVPCANPDPSYCEDHGMYAWGVVDLYIGHNYVDGWTNSGSGGAVKIRNSERVRITENHFKRSGVLAHTHWHRQPQHLRNVRIDHNRLDLDGGTGKLGIVYWRSNVSEQPETDHCEPNTGERDILLTGNRFVHGGMVVLKCASGDAFCLEDNTGAQLQLEVPGVRPAGCDSVRDWEMPLGGVHRGDFNGDGRADFVHLVRNLPRETVRWRAVMSAGSSGRVHLTWDGDVSVAGDTDAYGVQVGDFDGDGLDDLAYRGGCGSPAQACWRVHLSSGSRFSKARDFGDGGGATAATYRLGMHVGDLDGDGRDDIVFRGRCMADGDASCWTVLAGGATGFSARDAGEEMAGISPDTDEFGLFVGDVNGDRRADVVYAGTCAGRACLHVYAVDETGRLSSVAQRADLRYDGAITPHFGFRAGDFNQDGSTDLAYRGRCGQAGAAAWRYHLGGPAAVFKTVCSAAFGL